MREHNTIFHISSFETAALRYHSPAVVVKRSFLRLLLSLLFWRKSEEKREYSP
jgi:hypothetical protein